MSAPSDRQVAQAELDYETDRQWRRRYVADMNRTRRDYEAADTARYSLWSALSEALFRLSKANRALEAVGQGEARQHTGDLEALSDDPLHAPRPWEHP